MLTKRTLLGCAGAGLAFGLTGCGDAPDYAAAASAGREPLAPAAGLAECVRYATLAANGHNTQPWRFAVQGNGVSILPDLSRRTPVVDPDDHHLWASLGCAAENLMIAGRARGLHGALRHDPAGDGRLILAMDPGPAEAGDLFEAIPRRQCTRSDHDGRAVAPADLAALEAAARIDGVRVILILDRQRIEAVVEQVVAGNTAQMRDEAFVAELKEWLRFDERQALATRDGLFAAASGNPVLPAWISSLMFPFVVTTSGENEKHARQIRSSAGIAVFVAAADDPAHWVQAGRSYQRFALKATALGIANAFVNQPVEVPPLRGEFARWLGLAAGERPDLVVRFGYAPPLPMSLRRPVEDVLV
jgi:hypothetical protein